MTEGISVVDNTAMSRYEVALPGGEPAVLEYRKGPGTIALTHTGVPKEAEGQGIAGALTKHALDTARAAGLRIIPQCPYVKAYLQRHPEYSDLVAGGA